MSNLYRGHSIDASYQVSVHLDNRFQRRRILRYTPSRNKNCLWWYCLLTDRNEMSTFNRVLSIDASCQFSFHLAKRFQRRKLKCEKLTDDGRQKLTKGPGTCVGLYRMSEYSGFILVNRNTLGS